MSKTVLQDFLVKIGFKTDTAQLAAANAGMAKAGASAALLDKEATAAAVAVDTKLIPSLRTMLLPLTAVTAAIGFAYKEMFRFVESSAEGFERISHLANRVNTTADAVQKLGYIAQFTRSSVAAAEYSLDGLNRAAGEAYLGVGRAKKIFEKIGLSVKDSNGQLKDTSKLMTELSEKIKPLERGEQLAVLEKLGVDKTLIEALTTDVSKLGAEYDNLYKVAGIDVNKAADASVELVDAIGKVKRVFGAIKDAVAISFFDEFNNGAESFRKLLMGNLPKIIASIKPVITDMVKVGKIALQLGVIFGGMASNLISFITKINDLTGGWAVKIAAVTYAWKKLNLAFLVSPIGIIIELATALSLLYDDYKVWEKGGNSFIDWGGRAKVVVKLVSDAISILKWEFKTIYAFIEGAVNIFERFVSAIERAIDIFANFGSKVHDVFSGISDDVNKTFDKASKLFDKIPGFNYLENNLSSKGLGGALFSPQTAPPSPNNKNVTINHKTDINVNGAGNPYETAVAVKNQQRYIYRDQIRYQQGAVR